MTRKLGYVYILASGPHGTLYIGVTSNLLKRVEQHKEKSHQGFTSSYGVDRLVYFEVFPSIVDAIRREKVLKKWNRRWKVELIRRRNPRWEDLAEELERNPGVPFGDAAMP